MEGFDLAEGFAWADVWARALGSVAAGPPQLAKFPTFEPLAADVPDRSGRSHMAEVLRQVTIASDLNGALQIELGREQLKALDEIYPGPGGPAPEAYAW